VLEKRVTRKADITDYPLITNVAKIKQSEEVLRKERKYQITEKKLAAKEHAKGANMEIRIQMKGRL